MMKRFLPRSHLVDEWLGNCESALAKTLWIHFHLLSSFNIQNIARSKSLSNLWKKSLLQKQRANSEASAAPTKFFLVLGRHKGRVLAYETEVLCSTPGIDRFFFSFHTDISASVYAPLTLDALDAFLFS